MAGEASKIEQKKSQYSRSAELTLAIAFILLIVGSVVLPPIHLARGPAYIARAKSEMAGIIAAISAYQTQYRRFPVSSIIESNTSSDFTFGTFGTSAALVGITNAHGYQANNSEVMAILLDLTKFPNGNDTVNTNHSRNPQQTPFINVKIADDTNSHGLGPDGVYRDPWGNPYIISFDLNHDTKCRDAFYRLASVSEIDPGSTSGLNRLFRFTPPPYNSPESRDAFEAQTTVMVWSLGPDGKADKSQKANSGVNKDNVLSW